MIAKQIGNWTFIREVDYKNRSKYLIECACGKQRVVDPWDYNNIHNPKSNHLGLMCKECAERQRWEKADKVTKLYRLIYMDYKHQAARRNISFTLTDKQAYKLFISNCHYCGDKPSNVKKHGKNKTVSFEYQGIDRKDPSLGYHVENCLPACKKCNYAKRDMNYDEFIFWLNKAYNFVVQRPSRKRVGPSGPKQELSLWENDMVYSA